MNKICNKLIDYMINKQIIDKNKKDIYLYGMKLTIYKIAYAFIILSICLILKRSFFELILFYLSYMTIRKYSGGYHAPNIQLCMLIFAFTYFLLEYFILLFSNVDIAIILALSLIFIYIIYHESPVDCENKRLSVKEKIKYKKYTLYISIFWLIVMLILYAFNFSAYTIILFSYVSICIFLLI